MVKALSRSLLGLLSCFLSSCVARQTPLVFQVASSSMYPELLGPMRTAHCPHCQQSWGVAAETYQLNRPTRCDQCGGLCEVGQDVLPGERVAIEPLNERNPIERFELVVFVDASTGATLVKRVWALPGEQIELRDGEVFIDGKLLQKSLHQLQQVCVSVSDTAEARAAHWTLGEAHSARSLQDIPRTADNTFMIGLTSQPRLSWKYQKPAAVHPQEVAPTEWLQPSPLDDDYRANQGVSCQLHPVDDFGIAIATRTRLTAPLQVVMRIGGLIVPIVVAPEPIGHPEANVQMARSVAPQPAGATTANDAVEPAPSLGTQSLKTQSLRTQSLGIEANRFVQLAWCDKRLLIESDLDHRAIDLPHLKLQFQPTKDEPTAILAAGEMIRIETTEAIELTRIAVIRDLYFESWPLTTSSTVMPGTQGYFVMGDNLPVSLDSRHQLGRIQRSQIIGRIISPRERNPRN